MEFNNLIYDKSEGIATITLNRPDRLNALSPFLLDEIPAALDDADADDDVRVIILTGAGRGFCSGADLAPDARAGYPDWPGRRLALQPWRGFGATAKRLRAIDKPVLGAINGAAAGAGFALACGCDIRFASEQARFSAIFVRRGLHPDTGLSFYLPRIVGIPKALEMMWTGDVIDAAEALRIGLVTKVVPPDQLIAATREFAARLVKGAALSIELIKRITYKGLDIGDLDIQMGYEGWAQSICSASADVIEGRTSFLEKREPTFRGR